MAEFEECCTLDCPSRLRRAKHAHVKGSQGLKFGQSAKDFLRASQKTVDGAREASLTAMGYVTPRKLASDEWAAIKFLPDAAVIYVGLNAHGIWTAAFAFDDPHVAINALKVWDGRGFPPKYAGRGMM